MKYSIVSPENPALRAKARLISEEEIEGEYVRTLIADMKGILAGEKLGVAIAAPQVGEAVQIFVVSGKVFDSREGVPDEEQPKNPDVAYINPEILKYSQKKMDMHEGCLTLPGLWGMVPRAERVRISYSNEQGERVTRGASGLLAHVFQHECDHLQGVIYTDKAHDVYEEAEPVEPDPIHE